MGGSRGGKPFSNELGGANCVRQGRTFHETNGVISCVEMGECYNMIHSLCEWEPSVGICLAGYALDWSYTRFTILPIAPQAGIKANLSSA